MLQQMRLAITSRRIEHVVAIVAGQDLHQLLNGDLGVAL